MYRSHTSSLLWPPTRRRLYACSNSLIYCFDERVERPGESQDALDGKKSVLCFNSNSQCNGHDENLQYFTTSFPKQILIPSRFKFILPDPELGPWEQAVLQMILFRFWASGVHIGCCLNPIKASLLLFRFVWWLDSLLLKEGSSAFCSLT